MHDTSFTFSHSDREFLRQLNIDPEPSLMDDVIDMMSESSQGQGFHPQYILISQDLARKICKEYGEVNLTTYMAYRVAHKDD